jgi:hypothetical protein
MKAITARRCLLGDHFRADRHVYAVEVDGETFYACEACVSQHDGPGAHEGYSEDSLATLLVLEHLDGDGGADFFLSDESGYAAQLGRFVYKRDDRGFHSYEEFSSPEEAVKHMNGMEDDGFGADESDAYITFTPRGVEVSFDGKHIGTYERESRARAAVSVEMRRSGYFPNVFLCGEHGPTIRRIDVW